MVERTRWTFCHLLAITLWAPLPSAVFVVVYVKENTAVQRWFEGEGDQVLNTFLGAFLGFLLALVADRIVGCVQDRKRRKDLIVVLLHSLDDLHTKSSQVLDELGAEPEPPGVDVFEDPADYVQYYHLDTSILDATAAEWFELMDTDNASELSRIRYEIVHAGRKVDARFSIFVNAGFGLDDPAVLKRLRTLGGSLRVHLPKIIASIDTFRKKLRSEAS